MKKLVKIKFRDKTSITMPLEEVEAILNSKEQIIMLYDGEGKWTGRTVNKSEIIGTDRDFYEESRENSKGEVKALGEPNMTKERRIELFTKFRPKKEHGQQQ